jgi:2-dehydropantoate 2-reductase
MKVCVYGAGAIGAYLGVALVDAGCDVSFVARGPHLAALRKNGLTLEIGGTTRNLRIPVTDDAASIGTQDYVILTLKAHSVAPVATQIATLLGPSTAVVTAQNGILWWYFYKFPGPLENRHLDTVDPGGRVWKTLGPERAIGCVVYPSCEIVAPGVVRHVEGNRFMLGEPDGSKSARVAALAQALTSGGLKAPVRPRIRDDIWFKLLGNATFNPVSVLTRATLEQMGRDAGVRAVIRRMMSEAQDVATKLGVEFPMELEKRIDGAVAVGAHKTSMLQDYELGRPLEVDALVASVAEIARLVDVPTPTLDAVLALVRLRIEVDKDATRPR